MTASTSDFVHLTRVLDAPREIVFKAWTDPEKLKRWWGPKGFTTPFCKVDLRPGGVFHNCMKSPEGREYWSKGVYLEIVEPERLVFTDSFVDEKGNTVSPTYYGMSPDWPTETLVTVTFDKYQGKTKLTLRHGGDIKPGEDHDMCEAGWSETLDRLAEEVDAKPSKPKK